jgi:hypothetical protein
MLVAGEILTKEIQLRLWHCIKVANIEKSV